MMTIELMRSVLGWSALINYLILLYWFLFITFAHQWTYRLHNRWFNISTQHFDTIHYAGIAVYKIGILLFNLVPFIALWIVS